MIKLFWARPDARKWVRQKGRCPIGVRIIRTWDKTEHIRTSGTKVVRHVGTEGIGHFLAFLTEYSLSKST